jgi:hypothetical protein
MKTFEWLFLVVVFTFSTHRCGKSIDKRNWGESIAEFLFSLGLVLLAVKNSPPF